MKSFLNEELKTIIIDESLINGIKWGNNFEDLIINIDWCGQENLKHKIDFTKVKTFLHFSFVTEAFFNFHFKNETMGALEITSFSFQKSDNIWKITFEFKFYPIGFIRFNCNDFEFVIEDEIKTVE